MIPLEPVILVEGKYDQIKLSGIFDGLILTTEGFGIFKQPEKRALLRRLARERGLLIFTDPDGAGFVIRNYLRGILSEGTVYHAYLPDLYGKEKRKAHVSKEGKLGVEGMTPEVILAALRNAGATIEGEETTSSGGITKQDLMALGLSGGSAEALMLALCRRIDSLNDIFSIPHTIREYGIDEGEFLEKLPAIAENAVGDACTGSNPRPIDSEKMAELFKCCYYVTPVNL